MATDLWSCNSIGVSGSLHENRQMWSRYLNVLAFLDVGTFDLREYVVSVIGVGLD